MELGFDYAVTIDADGQHYPEDIRVLLRAHEVHPNALIVGSRQFTDNNMPGKSKFANRFSNFWFTLQTTINLPDTQTGMRLYPLHQLYGLNLITSRYEAELELLVFAAWHNVPLVPVPIRVYYPPLEQRVSHFRPAYDFTRISILNCFLCVGALLFGYINMYWRTVLCFAYFGVTMLLIVNPLTWLFFALHGRNARSRALYHKMAWRVAAHYTRRILGLRFTVKGRQAAPVGYDQPAISGQQSIIISNHQSFIDIIATLSLSPTIVMVVKDYVWYNPFLGVVARYLDCVPTSYDDERREPNARQHPEHQSNEYELAPAGSQQCCKCGQHGHECFTATIYQCKQPCQYSQQSVRATSERIQHCAGQHRQYCPATIQQRFGLERAECRELSSGIARLKHAAYHCGGYARSVTYFSDRTLERVNRFE